MHRVLISTISFAAALTAGAALAETSAHECGADAASCAAQAANSETAKPVAQLAGINFSGFYVGATGGAAFFGDTEFDFNGVGEIENEYDTGFSVQGQIGYEWDDPFAERVDVRVDLEAGYLLADVDLHSVGGAGLPGSDGETSIFTLTTNAYVDYNVTNRFDLFLGGGAGIGFVNFDGHGVTGLSAMDDDATAFVFHLDGGASFDLTEMVVLEARYRYTNAVGVDLTSTNGTESDTNVDAHQVLGGVRLKF